MDKKLLLLLTASLSTSVPIFLISWFFFRDIPTVFSSLLIVAAFISVVPIVLIQYNSYKRKKEIEDMFPVFLRDFVEATRGGLTVPQAFKSLTRNDYASLTPLVKKMTARLDWGISAEKVLMKFIDDTKSKIIGRIVSSVVESHRFGGNLANTFEALSNTAVEIDRLRTERRLYLQSQLITGYIIFFVFLGVILGLERFLVPSLTQTATMGTIPGQTAQDLGPAYKELFRNLIILQGLFAGLTVGKMAEGAIIAGLKHSLFMMFVGGIVFIVFG